MLSKEKVKMYKKKNTGRVIWLPIGYDQRLFIKLAYVAPLINTQH